LRTVLMGLCLGLVLAAAASAQQPASSNPTKLHDDLRLTSGQEGAWQQYLRALDDGGQMQARRQAAEQLMPQIPTPRRLALMDATMADELAAFRRQREAVEAFYNRLTPDQQRTFDRDTAPQTAAR
jgi:periplasmic protein CpxP/Spy